MTTATADIDWDTPPRRPKMPGLAPLRGPTITITCRVCGLRGNVEIAATARLCRECAADMPATRARVEASQRAVAAKEAAASEAWTQYVAALPEDLSARFDRVWTDRTAAETALRQAERASGRNFDTKVQAERVRTARAALETIRARIIKTRQNPQNPLAAVLTAEAVYFDALAQAREEALRWEQAMQELEELPF